MSNLKQQTMFSVQQMVGFELSYKDDMQATLVNKPTDVKKLLKEIASWPYVVFDFETTGLSFIHQQIVGVALATFGKPTYYVPFRHKIGENVEPAEFLPKLFEVFKIKPTVAHNIKFDYNFLFCELERWGIDATECNTTHCTFLMDSILNPGRSDTHKLKKLIKKYFDVEMLSFEEVVGEDSDFSLCQIDDAVLYACGDAYWTARLFELLKPKLAEEKLVFTYKLEMDCVKSFAEMERTGLKVDIDKLQPTEQAAARKIDQLTKEIYTLAGHAFNIDSTQELSRVLFDELSIPTPPKRNKDGAYSTAIAVLEVRQDFAIVRKVILYRSIRKMLTSFLGKIGAVVCEDGRIRTSYRQCGARSGRALTSNGIGPGGINPKISMQQFPKKTSEDDINFRDFLIPPEGYYMLAADYKQVEYRLMAAMSGEMELIEQIKLGHDFHRSTAAMLFGCSYDKVTKADRSKGKTLNFGICYGMSYFSLARVLGIKPDEAKMLMTRYFVKLPNLQKFSNSIKLYVQEHLEVRTAFGRKRDFSNLEKIEDAKKKASLLRAAFNTVIQGTAADINKIGIRAVWLAKKKYGNKILMALNVHDELVLFIHNSIKLEEAISVIVAMVQDYLDRGWVIFDVDISFGSSYGSLKSVVGETEEELEAELPAIQEVAFEELFSHIVLIEVGEYADFKEIKSACSPAKPGSYRVVLLVANSYYLLPAVFTFNPTDRMLEFVSKIKGVISVEKKVEALYGSG